MTLKSMTETNVRPKGHDLCTIERYGNYCVGPEDLSRVIREGALFRHEKN
jgi:hypothetical protein